MAIFSATGFSKSPFKARESERLQSDLDYLNTADQVLTKIKPKCWYLEIKMNVFSFYVSFYSQLSKFLYIHVIIYIFYCFCLYWTTISLYLDVFPWLILLFKLVLLFNCPLLHIVFGLFPCWTSEINPKHLLEWPAGDSGVIPTVIYSHPTGSLCLKAVEQRDGDGGGRRTE